MGSLIEDLKKVKPEFRNEFDNYIQKVKLENGQFLLKKIMKIEYLSFVNMVNLMEK